MKNNFTAIILAGGKSKRIGTNKALLRLNRLTIIEEIYNLLNTIFPEILLITNDIKSFEFLTKNIYSDIYPHFGPLSGIHSGLSHSKTNNNFVLSCDMPLISREAIQFIISQNSEADIIIPESKMNLHSLCGIYKKNCLSIAEDLLKQANQNKKEDKKSNVRLLDLINLAQTKYIDLSEQEFYSDDLFFNMNTLDDYKKVKSLYRR